MADSQAIGLLVVFIIVLVVIFIVTRVFWLWYWKIYEVVALLKQIRDSLRTLERTSLVHERAAVLAAAPPQNVYAPTTPTLTPTPENGSRLRAARQSVLRAEPASNAEITGRVEYGAWFSVLTVQPGWIWIQTDDGIEGWLQVPGQ